MAYIIKSPAKYIQGKGELANIGKHTSKLGTKFFVICSENTKKRIGSILEESFRAAEHEVVFCGFNGECSKEEIFRIMEIVKASGCDMIVGAGGGKVIDTAKAVSANLDMPVVIIPTVASNDAPCSGVAVIYNDAGVVIKALFTKRNPDLVLVDTDVIAQAPVRLLIAGIGDALATWFEARAVQASGAKTMARGKCSNTALMMARLCYDLLLENGVEAVKAVQEKTANQALENVVEASIYLSGVGFESGGLAAAHAINDGFAYEPQCHGCYHGEKVAFGTLVQLVLEKADDKQMEEVLSFMKGVGLPMTLAQLGVKEINHENLHKVAEAACVPTQSTKNLSPDITPEDVYQAILKADEIGRAYLA